ncbi:MAG: hypothetical protein AB1633_06800, partial [Elusimicrobiota bacterium]
MRTVKLLAVILLLGYLIHMSYALEWTGYYDTPGFACGVAISGNYAYVADWDSGLQVIDIANPASPQLVGSYDTPDWANSVAISG